VAVSLTGAALGVLVLATPRGTCAKAAAISLAATLTAVVGPMPDAVSAATASVATTLA